jgi:D-ribulokinase
MRDESVAVDTIVVSGGAAQSPLVRQLLADATGTIVAAPLSPEPVLLGSAMLGATAAGAFPDLAAAMAAMARIDAIYRPSARFAAWHEKRFAGFTALQAAARASR